jgi:hypothetical protein
VIGGEGGGKIKDQISKIKNTDQKLKNYLNKGWFFYFYP